jgi:rhodanese-related sulfurtransferase
MDTHPTDLPSITPAQLAGRLGRASAPLVFDVRKMPAFDAASRAIAGAVRVAPDLVPAAFPLIESDRAVVVYCVHGHEVSQNAARALRQAGFAASFLEGGITAWEKAGLAGMTKLAECRLPATPERGSRWVTRERPKIDRIACPWLIRRFVDPTATFLYVPADRVIDAAKSEDAIPYDVPNVRFSHRGNDGELCSFDALVADLGLNAPSLHDLAKIVRGADTGKPDLTPQSAGLLAISLGLSQIFDDDHVMLEHGMIMYDALYAWIHSARGEAHNAQLFKNESDPNS